MAVYRSKDLLSDGSFDMVICLFPNKLEVCLNVN